MKTKDVIFTGCMMMFMYGVGKLSGCLDTMNEVNEQLENDKITNLAWYPLKNKVEVKINSNVEES